ncbi:MAG: hypothetical protein HRT88_01275 [Lentisphaeraceae bacterium]|nr:hypothetical protein [Lentisphaeraceae bacterium]
MSNNNTQDPGAINVYGGNLNRAIDSPKSLRKTHVIKASQIEEITRIMTIGGDCQDDNSQPPSIIIEREGDIITKIIVKCTCGRHAELSCEEEENEEQQ